MNNERGFFAHFFKFWVIKLKYGPMYKKEEQALLQKKEERKSHLLNIVRRMMEKHEELRVRFERYPCRPLQPSGPLFSKRFAA